MALTRADLDPLGLKIERVWREHRPNVVEGLEEMGVLYDHLKDAEEDVVNLNERLIAQGVDPQAAKEIAEAEYIYIPDQTDDYRAFHRQPPKLVVRTESTYPLMW